LLAIDNGVGKELEAARMAGTIGLGEAHAEVCHVEHHGIA
jgi:hypothetical protein